MFYPGQHCCYVTRLNVHKEDRILGLTPITSPEARHSVIGPTSADDSSAANQVTD